MIGWWGAVKWLRRPGKPPTLLIRPAHWLPPSGCYRETWELIAAGVEESVLEEGNVGRLGGEGRQLGGISQCGVNQLNVLVLGLDFGLQGLNRGKK